VTAFRRSHGWAERPGAALCIIFLLVTAAAGADRGPAPRGFDVERFDPAEVERAAAAGRTVDLHFFDRSHPVRLEPSPVRARHFRAAATSATGERRAIYPAAARTFRGRVEGDPGSMVRLSVTARGLRGFVKSSEGWTFIEPLDPAAPAVGTPRHKVFTDGDLDPDFAAPCPEPAVFADEPATSPAEAEASPAAEPAAGDLRTLELAADADFEFFSIHGSAAAAAAEIDAIVNMVDGIYELELGITIDLVHTHVWEAEPDPFGSTEAQALLNEFRGHWNANHGAIGRDTAHLFTGKNLDGGTIGLASLGTVCALSNAYGLSQDISSDVLMPLVVAHEIGHNLGAGHDPSSSTTRYIMYPSIGSMTLDEFSDGSRTQVANYVAGVSCLPEDGGPPPAPPPMPSPSGGGGGGPVDPVLLALAAAALLAARRNAGGTGRDDGR
jgi:hypothetical protein